MNRESLKSFVQNGKIIFDRNDENVLSKRDVFNLAHAFGLWLKEKLARNETNISVAVGTDVSEISEEIKDVFLKSFTNDGFLVFDAQRTFLPALFRMTIHQNVTGCVFVSVSDKDSTKISFEFLTRLGCICDDELYEIIDMLTYSNKKIDLIVPDFRLDSNLKHFAELTRQRICQRINSTDFSRPLRSLKFVIDTNEGIGSFVVDKILLPLGAEVVEVKGSDAVVKHCRNVCANAGIIFDYNLKNITIVSKEYGLLTREAFTSLIVQLLETGENEEITVLTNYKVSSKTIDSCSTKSKCNFEIDLNENSDLIKRQKYLNENGVNCPLSVMDRGYCCFAENYFLPDPVFTLFKLIMKIVSLKEDGKKLDYLLAPFYQSSGEWKMKNNSFDKKGYASTVLTALEGHFLKDSRWETTADDRSVHCKADEFDFEILNDNDEFLTLKINAGSYKTVFKLLKEIKDFIQLFSSLNIDEIEGVF
ncbi:MAG: hypothetical protein IJS17_04680 [Clostridia bacterium]|nr:hypothetical protein [Clostridia bacterium]